MKRQNDRRKKMQDFKAIKTQCERENKVLLEQIKVLQEEREQNFSKRKDDRLMKKINSKWALYKNNEEVIEFAERQLERAGE